MPSYISVANWTEFQNYSDRTPPWIRLYNRLLDNYEFACLQDASKAQLLCIWLLASRHNNRVPADPKWIAENMHATDPVDLKSLVSAGFITISEDASNLLAECKQNDRLETETERETDKSDPDGSLVSGAKQAEPSQPKSETVQRVTQLQAEVQDAWNATASECALPRMERWTEKRTKALKCRARDSAWVQRWREALDKLRVSDFCCGRVNGHTWKAGIDWFLAPDSLTKLLEGKYDNVTVKPKWDGTPMTRKEFSFDE